MNIKTNISIVLFLIVSFPNFLIAEVKPIWSWKLPDYELYSPQFSGSNSEIVLVQMRHTPDGHEAEEMPEEVLEKVNEEIKKNPRYADPEVIMLKVGSGLPMRIDWGRSPAISFDANKIVYSYQKKPISGFRPLAQSLESNDIRLFDRLSKTYTILASPTKGHLSDPIFSPDEKSVVYSLADAVNGDFGGNIGIGKVSISEKSVQILYPPTIDFKLYHLIDSKKYLGNDLVAVRAKPTSEGFYLAKEYEFQLLKFGTFVTPIYGWKITNYFDWDKIEFGSDKRGAIIVHDDGWQVGSTKTKFLENLNATKILRAISPDGEKAAIVTQNLETSLRFDLQILDLKTGQLNPIFSLNGRADLPVWSPDSSHIAIIATKFKDKYGIEFKENELFVFKF